MPGILERCRRVCGRRVSTVERIRLTADAVLIVGAGLAGLFLALNLAPRRALVLSPSVLGEKSASAWAQGGLAAALAPDDDPELHAQDTIAAGAGLVDPVVARLHRVLKPTGSLYLHCDPTASHYLKIVLDTIFGSVPVTWESVKRHLY